MDNIEFVSFTSAHGGTGCTSAAAAFAQISSRLKGRKVLFISLDLFSEKMLPGRDGTKEAGRISTGLSAGKGSSALMLTLPVYRDGFGVDYIAGSGLFSPLLSMQGEDMEIFLENISQSELYDLVVLDVPFRSAYAQGICLCCEKTVVVSGYTKERDTLSEALYMHLKELSEKYFGPPLIYMFSPERDDESFEGTSADIHGQFGGEVRQLAEELFAAG